MKMKCKLWAVALLASASLFGQSAGELAGRWNWTASCKTGETRKGQFLLRQVSEESFRGEFLGTGHKSDVIERGVLAVALHTFEFQREYVTAAGEKGFARWSGKLTVPESANGKLKWTGTLHDATTDCSFEATKQ